MHVVQPPRVATEFTNFVGHPRAVECQSIGWHGETVPEVPTLIYATVSCQRAKVMGGGGSRAAGILPFRFSGQAITGSTKDFYLGRNNGCTFALDVSDLIVLGNSTPLTEQIAVAQGIEPGHRVNRMLASTRIYKKMARSITDDRMIFVLRHFMPGDQEGARDADHMFQFVLLSLFLGFG